MARGHPLPDLCTLLAGQQRGRVRRPGGVIAGLDFLAWLGVDGIWLSPTMPSPDHDWGYDVSDYLDVHPELGTLDDLDELVAQAGQRGMRVLLDLVPNHTSSAHPWFVDARSGPEAAHRDYYVWADRRPAAAPEQLGEPHRRVRLDPRRRQRPVLPAQLPAQPAGPELVGARPFPRSSRRSCGSGSTGGSPDSGSTSPTACIRTPPCATIRRRTRSRSTPGSASARCTAPTAPNRIRCTGDWRAIAETYSPPRLLLGETWVAAWPAWPPSTATATSSS